MNDGDVLATASRALCEEARLPSPYTAQTRSRVLSSVSHRTRRGRLAMILVPLAALLIVSTARASSHGGVRAWWLRLEKAVLHKDRATARTTVASVPSASPRLVAIEKTPAAAIEAGRLAIPEVAVERLPVASAAHPASTRGAETVSAQLQSATAPEDRAEHEGAAESAKRGDDDEATWTLYAAAHYAHFAARDYAVALRAWNAYLRAAPDGPLAPEARYNRAIALARLGRRAEAREALAPFAAGTYGGYREKQARELLDALGRLVPEGQAIHGASDELP